MSTPPKLAAVLALLLLAGCASTPTLHRAAERGDDASLRAALEQGASPNQVDRRGRTALHLAAANGQVAAVDRLARQGAMLDLRTRKGETALFLASRKGHLTVVKRLLALGANPDASDEDRRTPLMEASRRGQIEIVVALLEAGADASARDENRESALMLATDKRRHDIADLLLEHGAAVDNPDRDGRTALYRAVDRRDREIVQALLEHGADPNATSSHGQIALIKALEDGDTALVELLLEHGADANSSKPYDAPALTIATRNRHTQLVELLLEAGAATEGTGMDGRTPLQIAVQNRDLGIAEQLLEADAATDVYDSAGYTPIFIAVQNRDIAMARLLIENGADPDLANSNGARALVVAINNQDRAMTELLLEAGAQPTTAAEAFQDPAAFIAQYGYKALIGAAMANATESAQKGVAAASGSKASTPQSQPAPAPAPRERPPSHMPSGMQAEAQPDPVEVTRPARATLGSAAVPRDQSYYSRRVAVVIGIDDYRAWPSLEGARRDAGEVSQAFRTMGFDDVIEIYDGDATRTRILTALGSELARRTDEDALAVIYFAGHGQTESLPSGEKRGYIVPVDADPGQVFATAISMDTLRSISSRLPAKQVYYAMDSCYSGLGFTRGIRIPRSPGEDYIEKITSLRAVQMITAGAEGEQAIERGGQGIFTRYFLRALEGEADYDGDGWVTASEIGTFVRPQVTTASRSRQTPRYGTLEGSGEIAFALAGH